MTRPDVMVVVEQLRRPIPGGIGTYVAGLLRGLRFVDTDLSVELLASRSPVSPDPIGASGYPVRASLWPGPTLTRLWDHQLVAAPDAGVLHATSLAYPPRSDRLRARRVGDAGRRGGRRSGTALVVTVHDLSWRHHPEASTRRGRQWHEKRLVRAMDEADRLVAPSPAVATDLDAAGVGPDRVVVIPHGCDHLPAPDPAAAAAMLGRFGVRGPFLLSVGTLEPRKNLERLFAAYSRARGSLPEAWPLVVVGPSGWGGGGSAPGGRRTGGRRRGTSVLAGEPELVEGVVAVGSVPVAVLAGLYQLARLLAYTPLVEGYGLPPLEAMVHGTPVVASTTVPSVRAMPADAGAVPDELGAAALVVDPFDVEGIAAALVQASVDEPVRSMLTVAGRALAGARTWSRCARAHDELWRSLR